MFFGLLAIMNSLIKYGFYFVVAFSVLAFGAAEDGKGQKSEVRGRRTGRDRSHPSTQSYAVPRRTEVGGREGTEVIRLRKATPWQGGRRSEVRHTDG